MPSSFSITFAAAERGSHSQLHPAGGTTPMPSRVVQAMLDDHRPWEMMDNMALIIVNQTYAALLEILGTAAAPPPSSGDGHHVEISRPVDPADPESPLISVNASATHCCICLVDIVRGGATSEYTSTTKQRSKPQYPLPRASVNVSPGTLHVSRAADESADCWTCADDDARPNVSEKGLFGVLDAIRSRLDAAIRVEARLIEMAKNSGCSKSSPKIKEIIDVRMALEKMRAEVDLDAIMRRRRQKRRRREIQEICSRSDDVNMVVDDAEVLAKRMRRLHVCHQKRCREVDDAEVLTKRLRALQV
ncbi:hypothetical protein QOZ80_2AG0115410 [Eleusine coracana subsp. coracana]|nr:hypothetical protein QOZ80_2AG0115410 [Eleusine coracana subsp. coracana]